MRVPLNHWYAVLEAREVRRKPITVERFGVRLVFWRSSDRVLHAQHDRCPHLGASLGGGKVLGNTLVCAFHGFAFGSDGRCVHAPALGRDGRIPKGLAVETYTVREAHGLIWLWWGDASRATVELPFFEELAKGWYHHSFSTEWPVHYTRAIENQMDVAHLPFVHHNTIGAGGRTLIEGPHVEATGTEIRVWATARKDDGSPLRSAEQLAQAAQQRPPTQILRLPGCWLLNISPAFKLFLVFVPVNERCTRYYLRSYLRFGPRWLAPAVGWLISLSNRYILNQDRAVVVNQTPADSTDAHSDQIISADRAIVQFRRAHARLLSAGTADDNC
jgi:hypothetical protein